MVKKIINKRLITGGIIISLLFFSMVIRLIYIQIYKNEEYNALALRQRSTVVEIDSPRGYIFDKNLKPLTNNTSTPTIIVPKTLIRKDKLLYSKILENSNITYMELKKIMDAEKLVLQIPLNDTFDVSNYKNVFIVDKIDRYAPDNLLSHVIGYINKVDNSGEFGLEKVYDENLKDSKKSSIFLEHDDNKSFLIGTTEVDEINAPMDPTSVVTTIDIDIQREVESIMHNNGLEGSVIVAEVDTGNISAIASTPNFNQDEIYKYLDLEHNDRTLLNKSIQIGYPPGSVFKIVVLLAALEENYEIIDKKFVCNGYEIVGNRSINCSSIHNHINLKEAFAKSCNSTFIQIGREIGSKKIIDMANRLNFGEKINIGLTEETPGNLPTEEQSFGPEIGNISIGQGKIEATPLQITNLLMTIANDGIQKHLRLIQGIGNNDGHIIKEYKVEDEKRVIDQDYAKILSEYLIEVVQNGTGRNIGLENYGSAGGKTGSAEATLDGEETIHGWFSGFYPAHNPKYVITVLIEKGMSGSNSAAPIFEEISISLSKR